MTKAVAKQGKAISIILSKEHAEYISEIEECFQGLEVRVSPNLMRFSEAELPMQVVISLGKWVISSALYDLLKIGIRKLFKKFSGTGISFRTPNAMFGIRPDNTVIAIVPPGREKEFKHIKTLDDLLEYLQQIQRSGGSEWKETTIEELVNQGILFAPIDGNHGEIHPKSEDYVSEGVPFIMASDLKDGRVDLVNCKFLPRKHADLLRKGFAKDGDVLLSHKATIGRTALLKTESDYVLLTPQVTYYRVRDKSKLSNVFLKYYFDSPFFQTTLLSYAGGGSTRDYIGITRQLGLPVTLPPLPEQCAIAAILSSLDDKIELLREQNRTLEEMAQRLFKEWFVDFNFPDERRKPYKKSGGKMVESELGEIPEGWKVEPLPEVIEVNPRRKLIKGAVAPYLDMKNLPTQGHSAEDVIDREFGSGTKFQNGDTLLARITPCLENGKTGFVDFLQNGQIGWGSTEYIVFAPKPPLPPQFGYLLARSEKLRNHAIKNMTGTSGRQRVPAECLNSFLLAVPPPPITKYFEEFVVPLFTKLKTNANQSRTLSTLRDTLLPKLIQGDLKVKDP